MEKNPPTSKPTDKQEHPTEDPNPKHPTEDPNSLGEEIACRRSAKEIIQEVIENVVMTSFLEVRRRLKTVTNVRRSWTG